MHEFAQNMHKYAKPICIFKIYINMCCIITMYMLKYA